MLVFFNSCYFVIPQDLALISIANIFHRTGFIDDGIVVAQMAWEISSELVLCQFTLANLYAAKVKREPV